MPSGCFRAKDAREQIRFPQSWDGSNFSETAPGLVEHESDQLDIKSEVVALRCIFLIGKVEGYECKRGSGRKHLMLTAALRRLSSACVGVTSQIHTLTLSLPVCRSAQVQDSPAPRQHIWLPEKFLHKHDSPDFAGPSIACVIGNLV